MRTDKYSFKARRNSAIADPSDHQIRKFSNNQNILNSFSIHHDIIEKTNRIHMNKPVSSATNTIWFLREDNLSARSFGINPLSDLCRSDCTGILIDGVKTTTS